MAAKAAQQSRPTLLVVDPTLGDGPALGAALAADGWQLISVERGEEALAVAQARPVDALALDLAMPDGEAFDLLAALRADLGEGLPAVLVSDLAHGASARHNLCHRYGLLGVLSRPLEGATLGRLLAPSRALTSRAGRDQAPARERAPDRAADAASVSERREPAPAREARLVPRRPVGLRGNFTRTSFPRVLHELYRLGASGALFLLKGDVKKIVYFAEGLPLAVKSNRLAECLGPLLVASGRLAQENYEAALEEAREAHRLQGEVLVERGWLTREELDDSLLEQLLVKLFEVFAWSRGEYQFRENAEAQPPDAPLGMSLATLIGRGVQQTFDGERLERELAAVGEAYPAAAMDPYLRFQPMELSGAYDEALAAITGQLTVAELIDDPGGDAERMRTLLVSLNTAGVLDFWDRALERPPVRRLARRWETQPVSSLPERLPADLEARLAAQLSRLEQQDHFEVLGLGRQAGGQAVEDAFDRQAWRFHPDLFADLEGAVGELAQAIFRRLRAAYLVLRNEARRATYLEQLAGPEEQAATRASLEASRQAAQHFTQGVGALGEGRYEQAARELRRASRLDPGAASYWAHLGWAVHKTGPTDRIATREAKRYLERAVQLDPGLDLPHVYRGRLALVAQDEAAARDHFGAAKALNPGNTEAIEQLQLLADLAPAGREPLS